MNANLPVRQVLFPEDHANLDVEPLLAPAVLRISPQICSRIGLAIFGLPTNAACSVMHKRGEILFYVRQERPFREHQVPVNEVAEEIKAFLSDRVRHIDAKVQRIEWVGNRLDAYLEPAPESTFQPAVWASSSSS